MSVACVVDDIMLVVRVVVLAVVVVAMVVVAVVVVVTSASVVVAVVVVNVLRIAASHVIPSPNVIDPRRAVLHHLLLQAPRIAKPRRLAVLDA